MATMACALLRRWARRARPPLRASSSSSALLGPGSERPGVTVVHPFMKHGGGPRGGGPGEAGLAGAGARRARLAEACRLVESLEWRVAHALTVGLERRSGATYVGKGKVVEVCAPPVRDGVDGVDRCVSMETLAVLVAVSALGLRCGRAMWTHQCGYECDKRLRTVICLSGVGLGLRLSCLSGVGLGPHLICLSGVGLGPRLICLSGVGLGPRLICLSGVGLGPRLMCLSGVRLGPRLIFLSGVGLGPRLICLSGVGLGPRLIFFVWCGVGAASYFFLSGVGLGPRLICLSCDRARSSQRLQGRRAAATCSSMTS